jgi:hypothetical protein
VLVSSGTTPSWTPKFCVSRQTGLACAQTLKIVSLPGNELSVLVTPPDFMSGRPKRAFRTVPISETALPTCDYCSLELISTLRNLWDGGREYMNVVSFIKSPESPHAQPQRKQRGALWTYNIDETHSLFTPSFIYMYYLTLGR